MSIGKVVKKVTSILLIVAMIMTSAGIQTFAGSIDDVVSEARNEKGDENLNRKYYDELINSQEEENFLMERNQKKNLKTPLKMKTLLMVTKKNQKMTRLQSHLMRSLKKTRLQ